MSPDLGGTKLWIAVTDKIGHVNQCIALADALGRSPDRFAQISGYNLRHGPLTRMRWRLAGLLDTLRLVCAPVPGRLVLMISGRSSELAARLLRWRMGRRVYIVSVGVPIRYLRAIDLAIISESNEGKWSSRRRASGTGAEAISILGAMARRFPAEPARSGGARPLVAVMIGGENKHFSLTGPGFRKAVVALRAIIDAGDHEVVVTLSRRTSAETEALLRGILKGADVTIHGREDSRAYRDLLSNADCFVVSPDSVTMLSEVCLAGKPVYAITLDAAEGADDAGEKLVEAMVARGVVRRFGGEIDLSAPADRLDEAARIAPLLRDRLAAWAAR